MTKVQADERFGGCSQSVRFCPCQTSASAVISAHGHAPLFPPVQECPPPSKRPPLSLRPLGYHPRARRFTVVRPHHPLLLLPFRSLLNAVTANCCPRSCQLTTDRQSDPMSTLSLPFAGLTVTLDATDPAILPQTLSSPCCLVPQGLLGSLCVLPALVSFLEHSPSPFYQLQMQRLHT